MYLLNHIRVQDIFKGYIFYLYQYFAVPESSDGKHSYKFAWYWDEVRHWPNIIGGYFDNSVLESGKILMQFKIIYSIYLVITAIKYSNNMTFRYNGVSEEKKLFKLFCKIG